MPYPLGHGAGYAYNVANILLLLAAAPAAATARAVHVRAAAAAAVAAVATRSLCGPHKNTFHLNRSRRHRQFCEFGALLGIRSASKESSKLYETTSLGVI